jgi:hypothetical protein
MYLITRELIIQETGTFYHYDVLPFQGESLFIVFSSLFVFVYFLLTFVRREDNVFSMFFWGGYFNGPSPPSLFAIPGNTGRHVTRRVRYTRVSSRPARCANRLHVCGPCGNDDGRTADFGHVGTILLIYFLPLLCTIV